MLINESLLGANAMQLCLHLCGRNSSLYYDLTKYLHSLLNRICWLSVFTSHIVFVPVPQVQSTFEQ